MARLLTLLLLVFWGTAYGNVPREATPAPASSVTVNGAAAETYGDFTFAYTNALVYEPYSHFTVIAQNLHVARATNDMWVSLPSSVALWYDANGNLTNDGTRSFAYDAENRLVTNWVAGQWKAEFVYDGLGRRRIVRDYAWQGAWVQTNETRYVFDGFMPVQERDSNNVARVTYTRGLDLSGGFGGAGGIGGLLACTEGGSSLFYHADGAGNVTALMDARGRVQGRYLYEPFGKLVGMWGPSAAGNAMRFSSMAWHGNSGLSLYAFREYDASLQRWLTRDPIGERSGIALYQFVGNSPVGMFDPDGLAAYPPDFVGPLLPGDWRDPNYYARHPYPGERRGHFIERFTIDFLGSPEGLASFDRTMNFGGFLVNVERVRPAGRGGKQDKLPRLQKAEQRTANCDTAAAKGTQAQKRIADLEKELRALAQVETEARAQY